MGRPNQWDRIKHIIVLKRASIILIIGSFRYGLQLVLHPEILDQYRVYALIREIFNGQLIGSAFIALASIKLLGVVFNNRHLKMIARTGLMFLWCTFMIAFRISPPPNTVFILGLVMVMLTATASMTYNK